MMSAMLYGLLNNECKLKFTAIRILIVMTGITIYIAGTDSQQTTQQ
jgi:hypothetical protein